MGRSSGMYHAQCRYYVGNIPSVLFYLVYSPSTADGARLTDTLVANLSDIGQGRHNSSRRRCSGDPRVSVDRGRRVKHLRYDEIIPVCDILPAFFQTT